MPFLGSRGEKKIAPKNDTAVEKGT